MRDGVPAHHDADVVRALALPHVPPLAAEVGDGQARAHEVGAHEAGPERRVLLEEVVDEMRVVPGG